MFADRAGDSPAHGAVESFDVIESVTLSRRVLTPVPGFPESRCCEVSVALARQTSDTTGMRNFLPLLLLLILPATLFADAPSTAPATQPYEFRAGSRDGIGKWYMGREIAHVMGHEGSDWLERPQREEEEQPTVLLKNMDLAKDAVVADIGAGTGYFSFRIAKMVPQGKVLSVDIQQEMLDIITDESKKQDIHNVEPVLGKIDDPKLPENMVDAVLMVDAYHEFDHPREMMDGIVKGLKPGGRVFLIEYRGEDPSVPIKPLHKMTEAQAIKEMRAEGLSHVKTLDVLPRQHIMIFEKPTPTP